MTTVLKDAGLKMARCSECDHDLAVPAQPPGRAKVSGNVLCTNPHCKYSRNAGKRAIS